MQRFNKLLGGLGVLLLCGGMSYGGILAADNTSDLNVTSVPGPGSLGYVYYNTNDTTGHWTYSGPSQVSPVPFVSIEAGPDTLWSSGPGWTSLTIAGTPTDTGVLYLPASTVTDFTIVTITLTDTNGSTSDGASIPNFQLGLLTNNATAGASDNYTTFAVTSNHSDDLTVTPQVVSSHENDFYFVDVEGAHAGDTITISGQNMNNGINDTLGGLTFDTLSMPEPASVGMLAIGIPMLLRRRARGH